MSRNFDRLTSVFLTMAILTGCASADLVPTTSPTTPATRDVPAGSSPPENPSTAVVNPTARPSEVIKVGSGGPVSTEQQNYLDTDPVYQASVAKLARSFDFWAAPNCVNRAFDPESLDVHVKPVFSPDGKTAAPVLEALMGDGQWHTYTVPFGDYEADVPLPPEDLQDLYEIGVGQGPLELTGGDQFLGWDAANSRFIRYDTTGKTTSFLNEAGQWEVVKIFNVCRSYVEAGDCPVSQEDLNSGAFIEFAKTIDTTTFPADVVFPPKLTLNGPPGVSDKSIFWMDIDGSDENLTSFYRANPEKLNQRVVAFGRSEYGGQPINIKVVKYLNPDGSIVYVQYYSQVDGGSAKNNVSTWPGVESKYLDPLYSDPTIDPLLRQWIETGIVPKELEGKTLWEFDLGGR